MTKYYVYLDDGHGSATPGKRTPRFVDGSVMHENEFNSAVVSKVYALLTSVPDCIPVLVSPEISDTPLSTRVKRANMHRLAKMKTENIRSIFISVHANALTGTWGTANGVEVFYSPKNPHVSYGKTLAQMMLKHLLQHTTQTNRGAKEANFYVIRYTDMPAILIEGAFMDNKREADLLRSNSFRDECAQEIVAGIKEYFGLGG